MPCSSTATSFVAMLHPFSQQASKTPSKLTHGTAHLTCYMALTTTWLTSSPCHHRHAITIAHLSSAQNHSWFCCHVFPASTCAGCWPTRPPLMPHPNTTCSWRVTEWCWLPMPFGTSHNGCMLHAWAMLRVLPSKAGCVRNMLWPGYALGMVAVGTAPLIASQAMRFSPDTGTVTSGLDHVCYTTTHRPADMLVLQQCLGSIDAQTCGDVRCGWRAHACVEAGKQRRSECRPST